MKEAWLIFVRSSPELRGNAGAHPLFTHETPEASAVAFDFETKRVDRGVAHQDFAFEFRNDDVHDCNRPHPIAGVDARFDRIWQNQHRAGSACRLNRVRVRAGGRVGEEVRISPPRQKHVGCVGFEATIEQRRGCEVGPAWALQMQIYSRSHLDLSF
jgi:hypothetical protein